MARPGHAGREPTLYFSGPRMAGDERVRKEGRVEEDMLVLPYPDVGEEAEIGPGEPNKWTQTEWQSVKQFLRKRGYEVDLTGGVSAKLGPLNSITSVVHSFVLGIFADPSPTASLTSFRPAAAAPAPRPGRRRRE